MKIWSGDAVQDSVKYLFKSLRMGSTLRVTDAPSPARTMKLVMHETMHTSLDTWAGDSGRSERRLHDKSFALDNWGQARKFTLVDFWRILETPITEKLLA